ncbi:MAG: hypothetical protein HYR84_17055 [Planctomycetes bacterium]|nr:hypothetical protein [Planctomycetota bacterium]
MSAPRLLLFGSAGAGKSALLAAVVDAAPALKAELIDESDVAQHFHVQGAAGADLGDLGDIAVLDCNGKSADEMLQAEEPFGPWHPMKNPILAADAVLLTVDVSAPKKQLHEDFRQAARWLKHLLEFRGQRAEVADLPVFVVLTKCDLLAKKDDTLETWKNRLEEAKRQYIENFTKYLKEQAPGFGTIKLKVVATATRLPAFGQKDAAAGAFGVAELFRECLQLASDFQSRRNQSQGRLYNVVVAASAVIALLGLSVAFLFEFHPGAKTTSLDEKVQALANLLQAKSVDRLRGGAEKLEARLAKLTEIETDGGFTKLPSDQQKSIKTYREELAEYLPLYRAAVGVAFKLPKDAKDDAALKEQEKLAQALALPAARAKDWAETDLGRRVRRVQGEYQSLQTHLKKEADEIRDQIAEIEKHDDLGNKLDARLRNRKKLSPDEAKALRSEADDWLQKTDALLSAELKTKRLDPAPGLSSFPFGHLAKFEPVKSAQKEWQDAKSNLDFRAKLVRNQLRSMPA